MWGIFIFDVSMYVYAVSGVSKKIKITVVK